MLRVKILYGIAIATSQNFTLLPGCGHAPDLFLFEMDSFVSSYISALKSVSVTVLITVPVMIFDYVLFNNYSPSYFPLSWICSC